MNDEQAYTAQNQKPKCERCGDLYYDPKTLIECEKQRAAEWEDIAKKAQAECLLARERLGQSGYKILQELKAAREVIKEARNVSKMLDGIKAELEAGIYTVEEDEFATTFYARDFLDKVLETYDKVYEGK